MLIPLIGCIVLLIMGRDELDAGWIWGIVGFLALCVLLAYVCHLNALILTVPLVLVDIVLIVKVFGGDIAIR